MLKLDPKNTELLSQKQTVLNKNIETTEDKLKQLKEIKAKADEAMANGTKINEENYRTLQREIIKTQNKLSDLINENSKWTKAGDKLINWSENLDKISSKIDNLGNKLTTRLTAPILAVTTAGITYDAQIEKYETAFKTFLGSAEAAAKAINNIKQDAKQTPFDTTSLVKANQMLISTGVSADNAREDILALGEAVIATGGGNDELTRMASNLQQIKNAGKATAMDIRQFAYAGIDVYGILADYLGKTTEEIKDMEISYDDLTQALKKSSSEGGKYFGAMSNSSTTLTGQVSALKSEVQDGVGELTKSLMPIAKKIVSDARKIIKEFDKLSDSQKQNIVKIGLMVAAAGPLLKIGSSAIGILGNVTKGMGIFAKAIALAKNGIGTATGASATLAKVLTSLASPVGIATIGITGLSAAIIYMATKETEAEKKHKEFAEEMSNSRKSLEEYNKSIDDTTNSNLSHINSVSRLKDELKNLVDENGKVKDGYKSRADFILKELNNALGTEYKLNGDIIEGYKTLQSEIDKTIEKKRAEIILNAQEEKYKNAVENQEEAVKKLKEAHDNLGMSIEEARQKREDLINAHLKSANMNGGDYWESKQLKDIESLISAYENAEWEVKDYTDKVTTYTDNYEKFVNEEYSKIGNTITATTEDWSKKSLEEINSSIQEHSKSLETYKDIYERTGNDIALKLKEQTEKNIEELAEQLTQRTSTIDKLGENEVSAWKTLGEKSYDTYKEQLQKMSPEMRTEIQKVTGVLIEDTSIQKEAGNLAERAKASIENNDTTTWGEDMVEGLGKGIEKKSKGNWFTNILSGVAGKIASFLHFSRPDTGPLRDYEKWMPDMVSGLAKTLNSSSPILLNSVKDLSEKIEKEFNSSNHNGIQDFGRFQGNLNNQIIDQTQKIYTTPNITFNVQELDEAKLQQCFNYINKKFGTQY